MRVLDYGPSALLIETDDDVASVHAAIRRLAVATRAAPVDIVPGARTVLIDGVDDLDDWRRALATLRLEPGEAVADARTHQLPVVFDGADLADVARHWSCDEDAVVDRLTTTETTVAFCGFAPGFAYCRVVHDPWREVPRRDDPRARVPAGSVALAGEFLGFYPGASPGGWQLVGRTDVTLFDASRSEPALLRPGDRVRLEVQA